MLLQCTRHNHRVTKIECYTSLNPSGFVIIFKQFRTRAKNGVKKNLYKLMNNAIFYGKRSNSLRYKINNKMGWALWCGGNDRKNRISTTVAEKLIAVKLHKLEVKFNKPIHVGMCIFDISKVCLYEFHHDYMSPTMNHDKCKIMYTDIVLYIASNAIMYTRL